MSAALFNQDFERTILASMLFDAELFDEYRHLLSDRLFYMPFHRETYSTMEAVSDRGQPVCEDFVSSELARKERMNERLMLEIVEATPVSNLEPYIEAVSDLYMRREVIGAADEAKRKIVEEHESGQASVLALQSTLAQIADTDLANDGIDIRPLFKVASGETEFILREWLPMPRGTVSMLSGPGGTGKTWLAIQAALRHAIDNPDKRVLLWLSEDPDYESRMRAQAIAKEILGGKALDEAPNLDIIDAPPMHLMHKGAVNSSAFFRMKRKLIGYDMIVLDPMLGFFRGNENDNGEAWVFMQPFKDWAADRKIVILMLHHSRKGGDDGAARTRGAGAFVDACRIVYEADRIYADPGSKQLDEEQLHMRDIVLRKDNYGAIKMLRGSKIQRHTTPRRTAAVVHEYTGHRNVSNPTLDGVEMVVIN